MAGYDNYRAGDVLRYEYSFGRLVLQGHNFRANYDADLMIYYDGSKFSELEARWWRDEGHLLKEGDLISALQVNPQVVVVGTGAYDRMVLEDGLEEKLAGKGIRLEAYPTEQALKRFKELASKGIRVVGAFHLTC